jgi:hypothetical protein
VAKSFTFKFAKSSIEPSLILELSQEIFVFISLKLNDKSLSFISGFYSGSFSLTSTIGIAGFSLFSSNKVYY